MPTYFKTLYQHPPLANESTLVPSYLRREPLSSAQIDTPLGSTGLLEFVFLPARLRPHAEIVQVRHRGGSEFDGIAEAIFVKFVSHGSKCFTPQITQEGKHVTEEILLL